MNWVHKYGCDGGKNALDLNAKGMGKKNPGNHEGLKQKVLWHSRASCHQRGRLPK